ncbi:MAG: response regulator [Polyangiaceae bacterium]|nr:response regulator [Polyangiaceae bacterium]
MGADPASQSTVLVIDDALESVDVLRGILDGLYRVKAAIHSREGLDLARCSPPDLILLDVMMPGMDGYSVCQELKRDERTRAVPVIFITTLSDVVSEARGLELGAVDYITKPFAPELVRARVRTHVALYHQTVQLDRLVRARTEELVQTRLEIIRRLGRAAEYRDNETGLHVVRMSHYAHLVAKAYGLGEGEAELCLNAAPMHDIGKIGTPDSILLKPGELTAAEWRIMQRHTVDGAEIIGDHPSELLRAARQVALHHHERWDGTGYPHRLRGEQIPVLARIVALADVLDALLSVRPYKGPWEVARAVSHIEQERDRHFEARVVDAFREVLPDCLEIREAYRER